MKKKINLREIALIRSMIIVPVIAGLAIVAPGCAQESSAVEPILEIAPPPPPPPPPAPVNCADQKKSEPVEHADELPVFKGGDEALINFIRENVKYPEKAVLNGIQGKVLVKYSVETDCSIGRISVLEGVDPDLDREALRVVQSLPPYEKPGKVNGKAVAVWMVLPINFALN